MLGGEATVLAALAAVGGTLGAKLLDYVLKRRQAKAANDTTLAVRQIDDGAAMRSELWAEILRLRATAADQDHRLGECVEDVLATRAAYMDLRLVTEALRDRCSRIDAAIVSCDPERCAAAQTVFGPIPQLPELPWPGFDRRSGGDRRKQDRAPE